MNHLSQSGNENLILNGLTQSVKPRRRAFTLTELLVLITGIAILASVILPALRRTQERAMNAGAINNVRQLAIAWKMYGTDNNQYLPQNQTGEKYPSWVAGEMRGPENSTAPSINVAPYVGVEDYTNIALLMDPSFSQLGRFVQDPSVFLDPGDQSTWANPGSPRYGRVRSFSMSCAMGVTASSSFSPLGSLGTWRYFLKDSDLIAPKPSDLCVFLGEHPDSINDGFFDFSMPTTPAATRWIDMPGSYHNNACPFSFADGHAEFHRWLNPSYFPPIIWEVEQSTEVVVGGANLANNPDVLWLAAHMTAPAPTAPPGTYYP